MRDLLLFVAILMVSFTAIGQDKWMGTLSFQSVRETIREHASEEGRTTQVTRFKSRQIISSTFVANEEGMSIDSSIDFQVLNFRHSTRPKWCYPREIESNTITRSSNTGSGNLTEKQGGVWFDVIDMGDGTYLIGLPVHTELVPVKLTSVTHTTESDCKNSTRTKTQSADNPMVATQPGPMEGEYKADKNIIRGEMEVFNRIDEDTTITYTAQWMIRIRPSTLKAKIKAPKSIVRGEQIEIDGSGSQGNIKKYVWGFVPGSDCPTSLKPEILQGSKHTFKVLCSFQLNLTVSNEEDNDFNSQRIEVKARDWETELTEDPQERKINQRITADQRFLGANRCALHTQDADDADYDDHFLHKEAGSFSWIGEGYELSRIEEGPFAGLWYVSSEKLQSKRQIFVNSSLGAGGEVHNLNQSNKQNLILMNKQVRFHEKLHTKLAFDVLKNAPKTYDPAMQIESLLSDDYEALKQEADLKLLEVESFMNDSSREDQVKYEMLKLREFNRPGYLFLPGSAGDTTFKWEIKTFADLGSDE